MLDFGQIGGEKGKAKKGTIRHLPKRVVESGPPAIEPIQQEFELYRPKLAELEKQAKELKVTDHGTFQQAVDGAALAKGFIKAINGRKAEATNPYREFNSKVGNLASLFTVPFKSIADEFSRKSGDYQYQLELAEKNKQKLIAEANKKLQADLDKQAKKDGVEAPKVIPVKAPERETVTHTAGGHSQHLRKPWVGEIENGAILNDMLKAFIEDLQKGKLATRTKILLKVEDIFSLTQYYVFDQKLINQAVKMGVREIPGVKIHQKVIPVNR